MHSHVPRHEGLASEGLLAHRAPVLVWEVDQVSVLQHPVVVEKDEVTLGALDIKGLLLVDELHMQLEVGLFAGLVPTYVANVLFVVGFHVAETRST